jgi:hypothetical protein
MAKGYCPVVNTRFDIEFAPGFCALGGVKCQTVVGIVDRSNFAGEQGLVVDAGTRRGACDVNGTAKGRLVRHLRAKCRILKNRLSMERGRVYKLPVLADLLSVPGLYRETQSDSTIGRGRFHRI